MRGLRPRAAILRRGPSGVEVGEASERCESRRHLPHNGVAGLALRERLDLADQVLTGQRVRIPIELVQVSVGLFERLGEYPAAPALIQVLEIALGRRAIR